jgi:hypothetical protein
MGRGGLFGKKGPTRDEHGKISSRVCKNLKVTSLIFLWALATCMFFPKKSITIQLCDDIHVRKASRTILYLLIGGTIASSTLTLGVNRIPYVRFPPKQPNPLD